MAKLAQRTSHGAACLLLGLVGTALAVAAHWTGLDSRAELHALDWRLRHVVPAEAPNELLHVDIDDRSLAELGRWPWPRETLAGVIQVLQECGAKRVVLDIILPEPQKLRWVQTAGEVYGLEDSAVLADAPPRAIFDDSILARAIRGEGEVFLPCHVDFRAPQEASSLEARVSGKVAEVLENNPAADLPAVRSAILQELGDEPEAAEMVEATYLRRRGVQAIARFAIPPDRVRNETLRRGRLVPPLVLFGQAAAGSGFVTFQPDADGAVRRIPLLCDSEEATYPQFALAVAARALGTGVEITADGDRLILAAPDGARREIPLGPGATMLIAWAPATWTDDAAVLAERHISAADVTAAWKKKTEIDRISRLVFVLRMELLGLCAPDDLPESLASWKEDYWRLVDGLGKLSERTQQCVAAQRRGQRAALYWPAEAQAAEAAAKKLADEEDRLEAQLFTLAETLTRPLARPDKLREFLREENVRAKAKALLGQIADLPAERQRLEADRAAWLAGLRPRIEGKTCLVGSTSTGAADFVPTPLGSRTPGVVVHSNIVHTILAGRFLREAPLWLNMLAILAAGAAMTLLAAWRPAAQAGLSALALAAGYAAANAYLVFAWAGLWLVVVSPVAAMAAVYLLITVYRQLTEERAKRRIRGMFAHAMSETLVSRLEEDPSLLQLGGQQRNVTCLFSDLAGFTPLAERLGPEGTVKLLNRYFDRVADTVQNRRGGYLNKFLGDGVFAFFGAPVFQDDHPQRALDAAVDCLDEVRAFNDELTGGDDKGVRVDVRIGVATGEAMVGNCGSTHRMDYTAIGDCVNLAARLEAANKFFGTRVLAAEGAWVLCRRETFLARPLGRVIVTGQSEAVRVWNVLARPDGEDMLRTLAEGFAEAMGYFERQDFSAAAEAFQRLRRFFPDDRPTEIYLDLCRRCAAEPAVRDRSRYETHSGKGVDAIIW